MRWCSNLLSDPHYFRKNKRTHSAGRSLCIPCERSCSTCSLHRRHIEQYTWCNVWMKWELQRRERLDRGLRLHHSCRYLRRRSKWRVKKRYETEARRRKRFLHRCLMMLYRKRTGMHPQSAQWKRKKRIWLPIWLALHFSHVHELNKAEWERERYWGLVWVELLTISRLLSKWWWSAPVILMESEE